FQATPPPAPVKAVEEICVTCGGAHPYYQCLAAGGDTFPEFKDNIQGYVSATADDYNQDSNRYGENTLRNEMKSSIQISLSNQTNEIKNMMASLLQINTASTSGSGSLPSNTVANPKGELKAITTRSGVVIDGPIIPSPPQAITPEVDKRVDETFTDPDLAEYTIKFTFPADFVIVDYESDPRVPLILGRPFLRTARALIDVHEMILRDGDERLTLNIRHDTSSYSNQPQKESINLINVFNNSSEDFLEDLFPNQLSGNPTFSLTSPKVNNDIFDSEGCNALSEKLPDLDSTKYLHPPLHDNPLSGSTTYFSNSFLEEFVDELPSEYDDNLQFDIESDLREIEFLLYQDKYSSLKDSIDQKGLANLADIFVDSIPEMFTDEHTLDYSSPPIFDEYDDDFLEVKSNVGNVYDDPFDSKGEKIKESKLLIDELDLPYDFLPPCEDDSFISQDFSRVDALSSTNNEDKIFNP
nr:reverse transcriptase domain-containing protein [Tanacetum cinerariifolium]